MGRVSLIRSVLAFTFLAYICAERVYIDSEDKLRGRILASNSTEDDIFDEGDSSEEITVYQQVITLFITYSDTLLKYAFDLSELPQSIKRTEANLIFWFY